ncbi:hypothetical protein [Sphingomonas turrisvirgatae]|nr:hypothetical protein [Sphingomonas turrisvirgatae]
MNELERKREMEMRALARQASSMAARQAHYRRVTQLHHSGAAPG